MLQMKPRSPCAALCANTEITSCAETRKVITDSLRRNRNTQDLAGLPRVLSKYLLIYQNNDSCLPGPKQQQQKKGRRKKKRQPPPKLNAVKDKCACTMHVIEGPSLHLPLGS